jgi:hypothetical protein|tara:strand:+ start:3223 stop:3726 length:504 start_codon:yes stop_codon:yes gene_type:complete
MHSFAAPDFEFCCSIPFLKGIPMTDLKSGFIEGLAATVVLSAMMLIKGAVGAFPELDPIHMIAAMLGAPALVGWIGHFAIGTLAWGGGFALLNVSIPGDKQIVKGILFGIAAWFGMMVVMMPMAGAGLFGLNLGIGMMAAVMTLILHIVFGAVLGLVFASLHSEISA